MAEGDDTGRRPKFIAGDVERSAGMRRHPRPGSAPAVVLHPIDDGDDVTPLPQVPPDISTIDGFEDMPASVQRAFLTLHNVQREHDVAFAKLWPSRHVSDEIEQLRNTLGAYQPYFQYVQNLHQGMDAMGQRVNVISTWIASRREFDTKLDATLQALTTRLGALEGDMRDMKGAFKVLGDRIEAGFKAADDDLAELEDDFSTFKSDADKRIRALEDANLARVTEKKTSIGLITLIATAVATLAALAISLIRK